MAVTKTVTQQSSAAKTDLANRLATITRDSSGTIIRLDQEVNRVVTDSEGMHTEVVRVPIAVGGAAAATFDSTFLAAILSAIDAQLGS